MESDDLYGLERAIKKHSEIQAEANDLMRALISALQANAQELLELRQQLAKSET
ncbi:hypothetical protein SAMN05877809_104318 [Rhodobacter sp. JA431]|uniref:hypothetical protein n=1 Tax=Rhodobacter sp. JA431 TaxID=570013 RepID=UPI000BC63D77|nr:hypothetical protein [Rhodobacter sp. JA431]SOC08521.1 hypothetical protein SAMN05877809_104318 [Rhodobacter sp. JA431]